MTEKDQPHNVQKTDGSEKPSHVDRPENTDPANTTSQGFKAKRATLLFKQIKPQTLVFDNQPRFTAMASRDIPVVPPVVYVKRTNSRNRGIQASRDARVQRNDFPTDQEVVNNARYSRSDVGVFQPTVENPNVPVKPRLAVYRGARGHRNDFQLLQARFFNENSLILKSTFVIQAILNMLCQHIKDDEDQRKSLFMYMFKQLENLHVVSPLCADECFESIRNQYYDAFNLLILGFKNPESGNQRNELVISKRPLSTEALAHSISVLGNFMPPDWSPMSFLQTSRYHSEFIEECELGSGGFGDVYRVLNRVDGSLYAVKKIWLQITNARALRDVQREVQVMSRLKHENIVMFYGAWWEQCDMVAIENSNLDFSESGSSADTTCRSNSKASAKRCSHSSKKLKGLPMMLYVQMELCKMTLESFLRERNQNLKLSKYDDALEIVDIELSDNIFRQLLIAVRYIHSQSLMHRDLKPSNVFLDHEGRSVKVGDFGLARSELISVDIEEVPSTPLTPFSKYANKFTAKLGTVTYAAPEQLQGSNYSKKADMYSLGLIYFELLFPFGDTEMERSILFESLRRAEGSIPEVERIARRWPHQATIIRELLQHNPERRPTAAQLLDNWPSKSNEDIIRELQKQLKEKDNTIRRLNYSLAKQRKLIKRLHTQIKSSKNVMDCQRI